MGQPFPPDLPDLLRLACRQGSMRLNLFFGSRKDTGRGYQANLANSGNGWTVDYDGDALEAMTKVLRTRFGKMLERERACDPNAAAAVHPAHREIDTEEATAAAGDEDIAELIG